MVLTFGPERGSPRQQRTHVAQGTTVAYFHA